MQIKVPAQGSYSSTEPRRLSLRCPGCNQLAVFETVHNVNDTQSWQRSNQGGPEDLQMGSRICPNAQCRTHVFVVQKRVSADVVASYPRVLEDFNADRVPALIVKSFHDALVCQGERLWVPAAIMIRRTLEELCADKGATGKDLKARIGALRSSVVLPAELFDAIDDLRLLGNDAAHVEAKSYDSIGPDEIAVAVELTKEVLKAVYQYDGLLGRLRALKKPPT